MKIHPKEFYRNYQADNVLDKLDWKLIEEMVLLKPSSLFEFGCGSGKKLERMKWYDGNTETCGLDISIVNVIQAHLNGVDSVIRGDERHMPIRKFDVSYTCSVLDHIEDVVQIIANLKSISEKAVFLAETNSLETDFYYKHDYESFGFEKIDFEFVSDSDGAVYYIWKYITPKPETESQCVESQQ